ncbi:heterokaryon incompatibility protein-domain-containing protein [Xylaria grammica]|nr:heterokaryon incompatibility protein-domain-containing protein [Xylaria grammica]
MDYTTPHSCHHCERIVVSRPEDNRDFYEGSKPRQSLLLLKILLALRGIWGPEYDDILYQGSDNEHSAFLRRILRMLWDKVPLLGKLEAGPDLHGDFDIGEYLLPLRILRAFYVYLISGDYLNLHQDSEPRQSLHLLKTLRGYYQYAGRRFSPGVDFNLHPRTCIHLIIRLQNLAGLPSFLDWLDGVFYLEIDLKDWAQFPLGQCEFPYLIGHTFTGRIREYNKARGETPRRASCLVAISLEESTVKISITHEPKNEEEYPDAFTPHCRFGIFPKKGSSIAGKFKSPASTNVSSEKAFAQVRNWLQDCIHNHTQCSRITSQFSPTRLIKIRIHQDERLIQLKESREIEEKDMRYAALSYCWGGEQNVCTTKSTFHTFQMRIDFQSLPKTIQDAVIVTEKLGIQYLWIDAFCIIQDDETDKAREIDCMRYVYENAEVTIAASRAARVCEGFLQDLEPYGPESSPFEMRYRDLTGQINPVVIVRKRIDPPLNYLSERAWAFQERSFSHRILEYGSRCVHWSCQTHMDCDRQGGKCDVEQQDGLPWIPSGLRDRGTLTIDGWHRVVHEFSGKLLSNTQDRLPAIAGIAEHFGSLGRLGKYLAGIWQSSFPRGLLWRVSSPTKSSRPGSSTLAPSWSWASTAETVSYHYHEHSIPLPRAKLIRYSINRQVEGATYGRVVAGDLTLGGFIAQVSWSEKEIHSRDFEFTQESSTIPANIYLDAITGPGDGTGKICAYLLILLSTEEEWDDGVIAGLVLQKRPDHKYLRMGVFEIRKKWWANHCRGPGSLERSRGEVTIA